LFELGRRLGGERALDVRGGRAVIDQANLCRHMLVCGATGSGKTETLLRLAFEVARKSAAPVFYLDGKGDRETAKRFCGLMELAGRRTRVFPNEPFDAWRGEPHEVQGRLTEVIDYASEGAAAWYRDIAKNVLRLVCDAPGGPPRSSGELLERMQHDAITAMHPGSTLPGALSAQHVAQVRLRYEAFFGQTRGSLDGSWGWEDTKAGYVLLDALALREETTGVTRLLFEDLTHYFTRRKAREQFCLVIVDEFTALANAGGVAARVEQARGFNTALVLAPQVAAGMGDAQEAARILGSVQTIICHRVNTPEEIIALAGTRSAVEYSTQFDEEGATGAGSARVQHQFKIPPNKVRALEPGQAYAISRGRAMRLQVQQAPPASAELPDCSEPAVRVDGVERPRRELPF